MENLYKYINIKMIIFATNFLLGIFCGFLNYEILEKLSFSFIFVLLFFVIIIAIFLTYKLKLQKLMLFLLCISGFFAGLLLMFLRIDNYVKNEKLADNFSNTEILTTGQIITIPEIIYRKNSKEIIGYKFKFSVLNTQNFQILKHNKHNKHNKKNLNNANNLKNIPSKIQIFWYQNKEKIPQQIKLADVFQLHLKVKSIHGTLNDGSYNFDLKMMSENIGATAYVIQKNNLNKIISNEISNKNLLFLVENLRYEIKKQILTLLPAEKFEFVGIIIGLSIGEQKAISPQQWELLNNTGVTHLFAISGLHITMFAILAGFLTAVVWRSFPRLIRILPVKFASVFVSSLVAIFYTLLSGFEIPAQRTLIMLLVVMISLFVKRKFTILQILFTALFLVLVLDCFAIFAIGFWLSFMCVVALIFVGSSWLYAQENNQKSLLLKAKFIIKEYIITQTATCLITLPILLFIFQKFPLVSPISNLIAIPLVSFIITPLILFTTLFIFVFPKTILFYLLNLAHYLLTKLLIFLQFCYDNFPLLEGNISTIAVFLAFFGIFVLLLPKKFPGKLLAIFLLLPLFFEKTPRPNYGDAWVYFLDVGQNLSVVIKTQHKTIMYDVANEYFAKSVITPFLRFHTIKDLDLLIISHQDNDHSGGLNALLENKNININNVMTSIQNLPNTFPCIAGNNWNFDGVKFEILSPLQSTNSTRIQQKFLDFNKHLISKKDLQISWKNLQNNNNNKENKGNKNNLYAGNAKSCVLKITTNQGKSVLLTGDITKNEELQIIQKYNKRQLKSNILLVPHHGSLTSSSKDFLQAISPQIAVISVGFDNKFNHPNPAIIQRLQQFDLPILQTQNHGQITIKLNKL